MDILKQLHGAHWTDASERLRLTTLAIDEIERLRKQNAVLETELALVRSMLPNVKAYQTGTGDFTPLEEKE